MSASLLCFSRVITIQTIWMTFALAKVKMPETKKCKVTFSFDWPVEWNHGLRAVISLLFYKDFGFFSLCQYTHFSLIMAPIHKTVKVAHYFQICTEGKKKSGEKWLSKKCSSQTKSAGNNNHRYFINYYKWNCFKIRWRFQTRVTSLHCLGEQY